MLRDFTRPECNSLAHRSLGEKVGMTVVLFLPGKAWESLAPKWGAPKWAALSWEQLRAGSCVDELG